VNGLPGTLDVDADRELKGRERHQLFRRIGLAALFALVVAAAFNAFGQREEVSTASGPAASLQVTAPARLRGGVIFEAQFRVDATEKIAKPTLVLAPGWIDSITLNSLEPAPKDESPRPDGGIALLFPSIPAGGSMTFYTQWQVNPTAFGRKASDVVLLDGDKEIARVDRTATVFP
jgi:hypothetical protein